MKKLFRFTKLRENVVLVIFLLFVFIFFLHPVGGDGDIYHHMSLGRDVIKYHLFPGTDHYSFTAYGKQWIPNAWGTGVLFYLLYNSFGFTGIAIFVSLIAVLLFYLLFKLIRSYGVGMIPTLLALLLGTAVVGIRWPNRPEIIVYPFLISLLLINRHQERKPRLVFLYPLIFFLWANLYGASVLLGFGLLGLFVLQKWLVKDKKNTHIHKYFVFSLVASLVVALLNPSGLNSIFYAYIIRDISQSQGEWKGIFDLLAHWPVATLIVFQYRVVIYFLYLLLCIVLSFLFYEQMRKQKLLLILCIALLGPFFSIRDTTLAVVLSLPFLSVLIQSSILTWKKITYTFIIVIILTSISVIWWTNIHGVGMDEEVFSKDMISFFTKYDLKGNVFSDQQLGPFLSFYLYPKIKVFYDTRDDLFLPTDVINDYQQMISGQEDIFSLINKYHPDIVIADFTMGDSYRKLFYSSQWDLVYFNNNFAIFLPVGIAKSKNMPTYTALDPYDISSAKPNMVDQAIQEYSQLLQEHPTSFTLQYLFGQTLYTKHSYNDLIVLSENMDTNRGASTPLFENPKYNFLIESSIALNKCNDAKEYLLRYDNVVSNKLLFNWGKRIPNNLDFDYIIYYSICEYNPDSLIHYFKDYITNNNYTDAEMNQLKALINKKYGNIYLPIVM